MMQPRLMTTFILQVPPGRFGLGRSCICPQSYLHCQPCIYLKRAFRGVKNHKVSSRRSKIMNSGQLMLCYLHRDIMP